jgi:hypothetical protein
MELFTLNLFRELALRTFAFFAALRLCVEKFLILNFQYGKRLELN